MRWKERIWTNPDGRSDITFAPASRLELTVGPLCGLGLQRAGEGCRLLASFEALAANETQMRLVPRFDAGPASPLIYPSTPH